MEEQNNHEIEQFFANEIIRLNLKSNAVKSACKKFGLTPEQAMSFYHEVRSKMKKSLSRRAWTYLLLGAIFLGVGLFGTIAKTGFIFYGAIAAGAAMLLSAIGYFRISLLKS